MNLEDLLHFVQLKKGVTDHLPFDNDTLVLKVGGKMFLLTSIESWENGSPSVNLKCDPERAAELRTQYVGIIPGYHMNKNHWNTVSFNADVPIDLIKELIDHSYQLVFASLNKKLQQEIRNS